MRMEDLTATLKDIGLRIRLLFTRAVVTLVYKDEAGKMQTLQVANGFIGTSDGVEHAQAYGMAAQPMPGAEAYLAAVAGHQAQLVAVIVGDPRSRPVNLKPGEVVLWSVHGQTVWLKNTGEIHIDAPAPITATAPEVNVITTTAKVQADTVGVDATTVDVTAETSRISGGGMVLGDGEDAQPIARVGDMVQVGSGSSAGMWPIVSGSNFVSAS